MKALSDGTHVRVEYEEPEITVYRSPNAKITNVNGLFTEKALFPYRKIKGRPVRHAHTLGIFFLIELFCFLLTAHIAYPKEKSDESNEDE